jgi:hypothetical protein
MYEGSPIISGLGVFSVMRNMCMGACGASERDIFSVEDAKLIQVQDIKVLNISCANTSLHVTKMCTRKNPSGKTLLNYSRISYISCAEPEKLSYKKQRFKYLKSTKKNHFSRKLLIKFNLRP